MKTLKIEKDKNASKLVKTGYRMLKILRMLIEKPCSYQEINDAFWEDLYLQKSVSDDMVRMYINSLREIGCNIVRPSKSNSFCYVLKFHPFGFKILKKDARTIDVILKSLVKSDDWRLLLEVCRFFSELKDFCDPGSDLSFLRTVALFIKIDFDMVKKLDFYCQKEKFLILNYYSPNSGLKEIALKAHKISLQNSKLYLWGYNSDLKELQYLRIDRIKDIKVVSIKNDKEMEIDLPEAVYSLSCRSSEEFIPDENQQIIKFEKDVVYLREKVLNRFGFIQKILSYGEDCEVLEPMDLREEVAQSLREVLKRYD